MFAFKASGLLVRGCPVVWNEVSHRPRLNSSLLHIRELEAEELELTVWLWGFRLKI